MNGGRSPSAALLSSPSPVVSWGLKKYALCSSTLPLASPLPNAFREGRWPTEMTSPFRCST